MQQVDPLRGAKYPIKISDALLREDAPYKRQRVSVQCKCVDLNSHGSPSHLVVVFTDNHRPKPAGNVHTTIKKARSGAPNNYDLSIDDSEKGRYRYNGSQRPSTATVLMYNPDDKTFTLDKLDAEFLFNIRSTPQQKDAAALAERYPHIDVGASDGHGAQTGDHAADEDVNNDQGTDDAEPDPDNPYDYRHFLHRVGGNRSPSPPHSMMHTPRYNANASPLLSASSPARPSSPFPRANHSKHRARQSRPAVRPTREETDADNEASDTDPNALVIDMGDAAPINPRPWRSALGVLNDSSRGGGPISLRSAASSMSPSIRGESEDEEDREKEVATADTNANEGLEENDLKELADMAVDAATAQEDVVTPGNGWEDNEDDLEAELAHALETQEAEEEAVVPLTNGHPNGPTNGVQVNHVVADSSSESEEE